MNKSLDPNRFDSAIDEAIKKDENMLFEYNEINVKLSISRIVRLLRKESNMTQEELAQRVQTPQSFISRLENPGNEKIPSIASLTRIAGVFGYKVIISVEKIE